MWTSLDDNSSGLHDMPWEIKLYVQKKSLIFELEIKQTNTGCPNSDSFFSTADIEESSLSEITV